LASAEGFRPRVPYALESSLVYEIQEMTLNASAQSVGLIEPAVAGAIIKVPLRLAKSSRKAKIRSLKPIAGSA